MELSDEERHALSRVAQTLRDRFDAREIILYGSAARGQLDDESDIDLLVVLPKTGWEIQKEIIAICFKAGLQCGRVFSAICYTTDEMEQSPLRSSPLVLAARGEGRPL
jgi:tRNA nucleotidyltransferase (CCA-adding enzyme)